MGSSRWFITMVHREGSSRRFITTVHHDGSSRWFIAKVHHDGSNYYQWKSCESIAASSGMPESFDIRSALIEVTPSWFCNTPSTSRNDDSTTTRRSAA